jgi:pteridine reductase
MDETFKQIALVTGAAQRLGRAIAMGLAEQGYAIALHYNTSGVEAQATAEIIKQMGASVLLLQADLRDENQIIAMFNQVEQSGYTLRVLINSAAVMPSDDLLEVSASEWDDTLNTNLRAPWLCARHAAKLMSAKGGSIINITDTGANRVWTNFPVYTVSKAGLEALTRLLARSLAPTIRVNSVAPGLILQPEAMKDEDWQRLVNRLPMHSPGSVASIVQAVTFLLEDDYITGQSIIIDGGYQLL